MRPPRRRRVTEKSDEGLFSPKTNRWILGVAGLLFLLLGLYIGTRTWMVDGERWYLVVGAVLTAVGLLSIAIARFGSDKLVEEAAKGI